MSSVVKEEQKRCSVIVDMPTWEEVRKHAALARRKPGPFIRCLLEDYVRGNTIRRPKAAGPE